jgi:hypothetical protein
LAAWVRREEMRRGECIIRPEREEEEDAEEEE